MERGKWSILAVLQFERGSVNDRIFVPHERYKDCIVFSPF
jgi:hypothetical protein